MAKERFWNKILKEDIKKLSYLSKEEIIENYVYMKYQNTTLLVFIIFVLFMQLLKLLK